MKKTYKNVTKYAMWVILVGLVIAIGPTIGFGQDANELASQVTDEAGGEPADEVANEPADEPEVNDVSDEMAGEVADEPMNEPIDEAVPEPANEVVSEPANRTVSEVVSRPALEPGTEPAVAPAEEAVDRPMNRRGNWRQDRPGNEVVNASGTTRATYSIVTERNMFSRNRTRAVPFDDRPQNVVRAPDPNEESYYVLRGIVRENNTFIAFLQDNRQGGVLQLREGDKVARGTVKSLTLDSLEYDREGKTTAVAFGHDLEGGTGVVNLSDVSQWSSTSYAPATDYSSSGRRARDTSGRTNDRYGNNGRLGNDRITSTRSSSTPTADEPLAGDAAAALLQRLMERRQQQMGQ